jgi:putative peptidoglycan lipid II flippase
VPICLAGVLIVRVISAFKANQILLGGAVINLLANVALNLVLMRWWGVAGIAISTTLSHLLTYTYLFVRMRRLMHRAE